jgi:hypothetical protein
MERGGSIARIAAGVSRNDATDLGMLARMTAAAIVV